MRLFEVAHSVSSTVQLTVPAEYRLLLLQYVLSGFDQLGQPIVHSQYQSDMLKCLDCPRPPEACKDCTEIQRFGDARSVRS
jgi:hypothetical protein